MKHAPELTTSTTLPATPPNGLTCGVDWARDDHAVSIVDSAGREVPELMLDVEASSEQGDDPAAPRVHQRLI
jgi:hypothetical protein